MLAAGGLGAVQKDDPNLFDNSCDVITGSGDALEKNDPVKLEGS